MKNKCMVSALTAVAVGFFLASVSLTGCNEIMWPEPKTISQHEYDRLNERYIPDFEDGEINLRALMGQNMVTVCCRAPNPNPNPENIS